MTKGLWQKVIFVIAYLILDSIVKNECMKKFTLLFAYRTRISAGYSVLLLPYYRKCL